jgi:hypothetical protein
MSYLVLQQVTVMADITAAALPVQQILKTTHSEQAAHALTVMGFLIIAYLALWAVGGLIAGIWPLFHRGPPRPPHE